MTVPRPRRRVLLATSEPAHPVAAGGIQASAHDLLSGLATVGCDVRLLTSVGAGDFPYCRKRLERFDIQYVCKNEDLHYNPGSYEAVLTASTRFVNSLKECLQVWQPEVVVAQAAGWRDVVIHCSKAQVPVIHWLHGWLGLLGDAPIPAANLLLANSEYTADFVALTFGLKSLVFHPPVEPDRIRADRSAGPHGAITLINAHPSKGVFLFLDLARHFPTRRFIVVNSWGTAPYIDKAISRVPNVEHLEAQQSMHDIYRKTSVLIVPTMSDETFGRVVVEAQMNGIPVLSSNRGALPNTVGNGGKVVDVEAAVEVWGEALQDLLRPPTYSRWSEAALFNARRFDFKTGIDHFNLLVDGLTCGHGQSMTR